MSRRKRPVLGTDYIMDENGRAQFTRQFLLNRGFCCNQECRFCPWVADPAEKNEPCEVSGGSEPATAEPLLSRG